MLVRDGAHRCRFQSPLKLGHWEYMLLIRPASQELAGNPGECNSVASEAQLEVRNPNCPMKRCMV